jgi:hypothetical protein
MPPGAEMFVPRCRPKLRLTNACSYYHDVSPRTGLAAGSGSLDPSTCVAVAHWWKSDRDLGALLDSRSPGWQRAV